MAVREKAVGFEIFIHFHKVEVAARIFACAAGAGLAVANDAGAGSQQARLRKRPQSENHASSITAGIRYQPSLRNLARIELGNTIDSFREPFSVGRGQLVPGGEGFGVTKAECSA